MDGLERRSERILEAIVSEYIASGDPVGSRTLSKKRAIGLSAASIRNIMSDLTESGYITQPHVSAGRIPTDLGYRVYVDAMLSHREPDQSEYATIESLLRAAGLDITDLLRQSSTVLAGLSNQAGVVSAGPVVEQTFKTIELIKVTQDRILVVLISTTGLVRNKMIYDEDNIDQQTLESYGRMLNDMLKDLDLRQAKERIEQELAREKPKVDAILAKTLRLGHIVLSQNIFREVYIQGQTNILDDPEFSQVEKLKALLTTFEEKSNILKILDKTLDAEGIQIFIGSEHGLNELETCSIVAYPIRTQETVVGSIGIIGPKRMDYQKVVLLVDTTARVLTRLLKQIIERAA
ncbi:MAG: heat-inducible transcriptional repressor HrcA [Desulfomonile sp.]|jgi:heat-inducible transcriptional repressor|nr:heat-inducible transcriptional repressor HrcA [Deltaproteobacteria bacterium]